MCIRDRSKAQKALLDMLRRVGAMREDAARHLLLMAYPHTSWEPIVHQLECLGQIRRLHGFISRTDEEKNDPAVIEAIDIMLLMEPEKVELFQQGAPPFSLTFFKQRLEDHHGKQEYRLWRYDICPVLALSLLHISTSAKRRLPTLECLRSKLLSTGL